MIILEKFDLVFECGEILVLGDSGRQPDELMNLSYYPFLISQQKN